MSLVRMQLMSLLVAGMLLSVNCGGDSQRPFAGDSDGEIDLKEKTARIGEDVTLSGGGWVDSEPVSLLMLSQEQYENKNLGLSAYERAAIRISEEEPQDGEVMFVFELENSYTTGSGEILEIRVGDRLYFLGTQKTENGAYGNGAGPLTVYE